MRKLTWAGRTDVGMKRAGNEDAFIVAEDHGIYVVCDGMGGHASGEVASAMTTEEIVRFIQARENGDDRLPYPVEEGASLPEQVLSNSIQHANDKVYVAGMRDPKLEGMGTTVVAIRDNGDDLIVAHVGDSRIYRFRDGRLEQVTRDHSLLNHKIDMGELTSQEDIRNFKHGNIIVRAIGLKDYVRPETAVIDRQTSDILLLCSDGLTDLVDDWAIENVVEVNQEELDEAAQILIRMANDRGGKDNITVVLMRVDDTDDDAVEDDEEEGAAHFNEETTAPSGIAAYVDETTDPSREPFDIEEEEAPGKDYRDITDDEGDDRTAPHTPVFMWEDLDDEPTLPQPKGSRRETLRLDAAEPQPAPAKPKPKPAKSKSKPAKSKGLASIIIDDDVKSDLPSIIIDDSLD